MSRLVLAFLVLFVLPASAGDVATYGEELTDAEIVPISKLYASPDDFVGKSVKVEGRVIGVCAKRGCWMELAGDEEFESMRIKVTDGVIVFPMEAMGQVAVAEGVFTKIDIPATMDPNHKCDGQHDGKGHETAEGEGAHMSCTPSTAYQIMGSGATIRPDAKADAR